jgi:hypothetical protein
MALPKLRFCRHSIVGAALFGILGLVGIEIAVNLLLPLK